MDKKIIVNRQKGEKDWTLSTFESDNKSFSGVGVEDEFRAEKVFGETRIDKGEYKILLAFSPKFSPHFYRDDLGNLLPAKEREAGTPEIKAKYHTAHEGIVLLNVPKFSGVMVHWGATDIDTHGCYIVGGAFGMVGTRKGVLNSRKKYMEIYPHIFRAYQKAKAGKYTISIQYIDHE